MKKFKYIALFIGFVICSDNIFVNQIVSLNELKTIEKKSNYRLLLSFFVVSLISYCNHEKIFSWYQLYPCSSLIVSYAAGTFLFDTYEQYKIITQNLSLLKTIDKIYKYLKSALLIEPDTNKCFTLIEQYSSFSIDQIEKITKAITLHSVKCLNCSSMAQISYECPNIHEIICSNRELFEIITEFENDTEIYKELIKFKKDVKDVSIDKEKILKQIGEKIKKNISFLIKNKNVIH
jgi:hypothetical protein